MWLVACCSVVYVIWRARNLIRFQDVSLSVHSAMAYCKNLIFILCQSCLGSVAHFHDLAIFARLGIDPRFRKAPRVATVIWRPPPPTWIKVNTDGLSKNNPGLSACGRIFRDHHGTFLGSFAMFIGHQSSFYAEFMAVILAIEQA